MSRTRNGPTMTSDTDKEDGYYCVNCRGSITAQDKVCPHCGADTSEFVEETKGHLKKQEMSILTRKYPALRVITVLYQVIAVVIAGLTLGLVATFQQSASIPIIIIASFAMGFIGVVSFLALAESIKVFLDIEHNTRTIVELLRNRQMEEED